MDTFVHNMKSEIRFVKDAVSVKHGDGYACDVMPEHTFAISREMLEMIMTIRLMKKIIMS